MALCVGDIHGNYAKAKAFLEYKPDEKHIFVGDYFDSYSATTDQIIETFKLIMDWDVRLISNVVTLAGNHELHYLSNAHGYFKCSGFRDYSPNLFHALNAYKDKLVACHVEDDFLITHGGLSRKHGKPFLTIEEAAAWINAEWKWFLNNPVVPESLSPIFDIGSMRGGRQDVGGVFWCSIGHEKMDYRFNQIVGHTPHKQPMMTYVSKLPDQRLHVGIDCPLYYCFNTSTRMLEDFMPEQFKSDDQMRSMLERTF
jgi:hypothetical protein